MERAAAFLGATCWILAIASGQTSDQTATTEAPCDVTWSVESCSGAGLEVKWSGDRDADINVTFNASREGDRWGVSETVPFSDRTLWIPVEHDGHYRVDSDFRCQVKEDHRTVLVQTDDPNVTLASKSNTSVTLSWNAPKQCLGTLLLYIVTLNESGTDEEINDTTHTIYELSPYSCYTFRVYAVFEDGAKGNWSGELTVQTDIGVPYPPTALGTTFIHNTTVGLTWEAPGTSTGPILEYRIRWDVSGERDTGDNGTTFRVSGLTPYEKYTFRVSGITEAGPGKWSDELEVRTDIGVPHPPNALETTFVENTTVGLSWEPPRISTGPIRQYRIRWEGKGGTGKEQDTGSNDTTHELAGLTPYENYTFRVLGVTKAGPGQWSEELEVRTNIGVPHGPTSLTTTSVLNTTVGLSWKAPEISTGPILRYRIQRQKFGEEMDTGSNDTTFQVSGLTPYVKYTFRVLGITEAGPGNWSEKVEVQTDVGVPHPPTALKPIFVRNTTVGVSWGPPGISTGPILRYRIRWETLRGRRKEQDTGANETTLDVPDLTPYEKYTFSVLAITKAGPGNWSDELEVQTDVGVPHPPAAVETTFILNTTVGLSWQAPRTSTGPILKYRIRWERSGSGGQETDTATNDTKHEVAGLTPYELYTFRVLGITEAGPGQWSEKMEVRTDIGVPTIPRKLNVDHKTNISLLISWTRPEFTRAPAVDYAVWWRVQGREGNEIVINGEVAAETVRHSITGLLPYTNYSVKVTAMTRAGRGPATSPLSAMTDVGDPLPAVIKDASILHRRTIRVVWNTEGPYPGPVEFSLQAWKHPEVCSAKVSSVLDKEVTGTIDVDDWTSDHPSEVEGLTPYANYSIVVMLKTDATDGVRSQMPDKVQVPSEAPGEPQKVVADCGRSPTQAKISWDPPMHHNGRIVSYRVRYGILDQTNTSFVTVDVLDVCAGYSQLITGLRPERRYGISVTATAEGVDAEGEPGRPRKECRLKPGIPFLGNTSRVRAASSAPRHVKLEWTPDAFSDYMGSIVRYAVLVGREGSLGESGGGLRAVDAPPWANFTSGVSQFYQATPYWWNPLRTGPDPLNCVVSAIEEEGNRTLLRCTLGKQEHCFENETFCNGPLEPDTPYEVKIRAFTGGGYNETQVLHVRTAPLPRKSVAGEVAAAVVSLLLMGAVAVVCLVMHRKGRLQPIAVTIWSKVKSPKEAGSASSEPEQELQRGNTSRPLLVRRFSEHVRRMMSDSHLQFAQEFEALKNASPQLPCSVAESEDNRAKNRWMNIFPFDHSRVKLLPLCDDPSSDFINASYIPGPSSPREYIASQGPLPHTLDDFWRMVWEQSVTTIVMLTQCTERGKRKCERYWPDAGEATHYGDLCLATVSESMLANHVIRVMKLQLGSYERQVKQMHFTRWPDFGCPDRPEDLIEFVRAVREHLPRRDPGPILVHCSAGVGRTGTFIAVDRLSRQLRGASSASPVDIYGTILELRNYRTNMVQTEDQYIYIHLCVQQLIWEKIHPQEAGENIYSNVGVEMDTSF